MSDLISRADAVKTVIRKCSPICAWQVGTQQYPDCVVAEINALPSAEIPTESTNTPTNTPTDLISRADALALFYPDTQYWGDDIDNKLLSLPSADAVEVVRCKDCKDSRVYGKTTQWLACESVMEGQATDPNGYCYLGERKEP